MTARRSPATAPGYHAGRKPANAGQTYPIEVLTPADVDALLRQCSNRAPTGQRNQALLVLLYRGGLRISEALGHRDADGHHRGGLYPKDLDAAAGAVMVLRGKGDKRRTVGLDPGAFALLERWLATRRRVGIGPRAPLFCTLQGGPLDPSYVRHLLPRLARKAGIDKRVHAHGFRHTHAFELAAEVPAHVLQAQLGHESLATTDRYVRHLRPQQLLDAIHARAWPLQAGTRRGGRG